MDGIRIPYGGPFNMITFHNLHRPENKRYISEKVLGTETHTTHTTRFSKSFRFHVYSTKENSANFIRSSEV